MHWSREACGPGLARRFAAIGIGTALAACAIAYAVTWQWSGSVGRDLAKLVSGFEGESSEAKVSALLSRQLDEFMRERIADVQGWALGPTVISAARQAHSVHEKSGLLALTVEEIEEKFQIRKSLGRFPIADSYLRAEIARSKHFDRILFTDRNGYNVVVTNVSSDFVQSDEGWWQRAWSDGFAISTVQYDESMGAWAIDISVRTRRSGDRESGRGDAGGAERRAAFRRLPISTPNRAAGSASRWSTVKVCFSRKTSSEHSSARIMNEKVNVRDGEADARQAVFGAERSGQVIDDEWVTGYSRTAGGELYADLTRDFRFPGIQLGRHRAERREWNSRRRGNRSCGGEGRDMARGPSRAFSAAAFSSSFSSRSRPAGGWRPASRVPSTTCARWRSR